MTGLFGKILVATCLGVALIFGSGCVTNDGATQKPVSVTGILSGTVYVDWLGSIDAYNAKDLIMLGRYMERNNLKALEINLCSEGGPVLGAFAIIDQMREMQNKGIHITINVYGGAMSAAIAVISAADYVTGGELSWYMLHPGSWAGGYMPNEDTEEFTKELEEDYARIVSNGSRMTYEQVLEILRTGDSNTGMVWYTAQEALELGLIDAVRY